MTKLWVTKVFGKLGKSQIAVPHTYASGDSDSSFVVS